MKDILMKTKTKKEGDFAGDVSMLTEVQIPAAPHIELSCFLKCGETFVEVCVYRFPQILKEC